MNTRRFAVILLKLMLACFSCLPAIVGAQVAIERFAWVQTFCYFWNECPGFSTPAGIVVSALGNSWIVTNNDADRWPSWSPDATRIAFERYAEIMVIDATGGTPVNMTNHPANDGVPAWSPDGTRIAFLSDRDGQPSQLYLMNVDGSGVVRLTNGIPFRGRIAWSPDGAKIVFDCEVDSGNRDICSINADGTGLARLTTDAAEDVGAAWSPDGSRIAFSTTRFSGTYELAMMNPDGTGISRVGPAGTPGAGPRWSPDGNRIVYVDTYVDLYGWSGYERIYRINTDGTGQTLMTTGFDPAWGPAIAPPAGPAVLFSPPSLLPFRVQSVGTTSPDPQSIRLINYGSSELAVFSISANGDFTQWNTCNGTVAPGGDCMIIVSFTPTASGVRSGALTITDNAPGSPHMVSLSGMGNFPPIASFTSNCIRLTCTFDGSASTDPEGPISFNWHYGDGNPDWGPATVSHTYAAGGTYTVTLRVFDYWAALGTQSTSVTVSPELMHVGDLDGTSANQKNTWTATVTVTVDNSSHNRVANATVNGNWTDGGTGSCTTNVSGQCAVSKSGILKKTGSAMFTVSGVTHASMFYNAADNHDPDGDSTGTSITVTRP